MSEHTPTPWRVRDDFGGGWIQGSPLAGETYGDRVATLAKPKRIGVANAAFIVKAVNSHDALVKALEDLLGRSQAVHQWLTNWDVPFADDDEWAGDKKLFAEARNEAARVLGVVGNSQVKEVGND